MHLTDPAVPGQRSRSKVLIGRAASSSYAEPTAAPRTAFQSQILWPSIPKVPHMLRRTQDFKKFYELRVVGALLHVSVHMPLPHDTIWITTVVAGAFYSDNTSMPQIAPPPPPSSEQHTPTIL